jgi:hypothetical protein
MAKKVLGDINGVRVLRDDNGDIVLKKNPDYTDAVAFGPTEYSTVNEFCDKLKALVADPKARVLAAAKAFASGYHDDDHNIEVLVDAVAALNEEEES